MKLPHKPGRATLGILRACPSAEAPSSAPTARRWAAATCWAETAAPVAVAGLPSANPVRGRSAKEHSLLSPDSQRQPRLQPRQLPLPAPCCRRAPASNCACRRASWGPQRAGRAGHAGRHGCCRKPGCCVTLGRAGRGRAGQRKQGRKVWIHSAGRRTVSRGTVAAVRAPAAPRSSGASPYHEQGTLHPCKTLCNTQAA